MRCTETNLEKLYVYSLQNAIIAKLDSDRVTEDTAIQRKAQIYLEGHCCSINQLCSILRVCDASDTDGWTFRLLYCSETGGPTTLCPTAHTFAPGRTR